MTGATLGLDVELLGADRVGLAFSELLLRGANLYPVMDEIGSYLVDRVFDRFERGVGPDGTAWEPSGRAAAEGGQTLIEHGHYRDSFTHAASVNKVEVGTNDIRAGILNFGGRIVPKNADKLTFKIGGSWVSVDHVDVPARPVLGVNREDDVELEHIVESYMMRGIR